jgi:hypothetical protein
LTWINDGRQGGARVLSWRMPRTQERMQSCSSTF